MSGGQATGPRRASSRATRWLAGGAGIYLPAVKRFLSWAAGPLAALLGTPGCAPEAPVYDFARPRVIATTPAAGVVGVDPAAPLEVTFDEVVAPLDAAHVVLVRAEAATPALRSDLDSGGLGSRALENVVPVTLTVLDGGRRLLLDHPPLDRGVAYALLLSAELADAAGNELAGGVDGAAGGFELRFETAPPGAAGTLASPDPEAGPVTPDLREVVVAFDKELGAVGRDGVRVEDASGHVVAGESFLSADRRRIRRTLDEPLRPGERHAVVLGDLVDASGAPVTGGPWGFEVAPCRDGRAPEILGAEVVPLDFAARVTVRADEPGVARVRLVALEPCGGTPAAPAIAATCTGEVDVCGDPPAPGGCAATVEVADLCPETRYEATPVFTDASGRETVGSPLPFRTTAPAARPVIVEVLADATAPEETGEFVELVNHSSEPWDPSGWVLVKRTPSSETARSLVRQDGAESPIPGGATMVYATRSFDAARYGGLPAGAILLAADTANPERKVFGSGLSSSSPPALELRGPGGVVLSSWPAEVRCPEGSSAARPPGSGDPPVCGEPTPGRAGAP
jgi:hypothetical protein